MFSGVGGQGIILTTTVLAKAVMLAGYDVKVSEVHGMAQRGGSVVGSVRFGKKVYSPIIDKADFIIALEKLEAARYLEMLKPILPSVLSHASDYHRIRFSHLLP